MFPVDAIDDQANFFPPAMANIVTFFIFSKVHRLIPTAAKTRQSYRKRPPPNHFFLKIQFRWKLSQEENIQPTRWTRPELHRLHCPLWNPGEWEGSSQCWVLLHILSNTRGYLPCHHLWGGLWPGQHHQEEKAGKRSDLSREGWGGAELCGSLNGRPVHLLIPNIHTSSKYSPSSSIWSETLRQSGNICFLFWAFAFLLLSSPI